MKEVLVEEILLVEHSCFSLSPHREKQLQVLVQILLLGICSPNLYSQFLFLCVQNHGSSHLTCCIFLRI